jgi:hypothetical protein
MALDAHHQQLLQAFMWRKTMSSGEAQAALAGITGDSGSRDVDGFLKTINNKIKAQNMEISRGVCEEGGDTHYALVNLVDSHVTRQSSVHKKEHLELFKAIVKKLVTPEDEGGTDGLLAMTTAVNLARELVNVTLSLAEAESVINQWLEERLLTLSRDRSGLCLGMRGILELTPYLRDHFPDFVVNCNLCRKICIRGERCQGPECGVKVHFHCGQRILCQTKKCPSCGSLWSGSGEGSGGGTTSRGRGDPCSQSEDSEDSDRGIGRRQRQARNQRTIEESTSEDSD